MLGQFMRLAGFAEAILEADEFDRSRPSLRERFGHRDGEFPVCEDVAARSLALPFFPEMTEDQVQRVAAAVAVATGRAAP